MTVWLGIIAASLLVWGLKNSGYVIPQRLVEGALISRIAGLATVALLASLVVAQALLSGEEAAAGSAQQITQPPLALHAEPRHEAQRTVCCHVRAGQKACRPLERSDKRIPQVRRSGAAMMVYKLEL